MTYDQKVAELRDYGLFVGDRDPRIKEGFAGKYMVAESFDEKEFPIALGYGPWAIVGDFLEELVDEAHEALVNG